MKTMIKLSVALGSFILIPSVAHAQDTPTWGVVGGYSRGVESSASDSATLNLGGTTASVSVDGDTVDPSGYFIGLVYHNPVGEHWRFDTELAYRNISQDIAGSMTATAGAESDSIPALGDATVHSWSGMLSAWRFHGTAQSGNRFFWGAGLGVSRNTADGTIGAAGTLLGVDILNSTHLNDTHTSIAWQAGAGWEFELSDTRRASIAYRYFDGGEVNQLDTSSHSIVFGIDF